MLSPQTDFNRRQNLPANRDHLTDRNLLFQGVPIGASVLPGLRGCKSISQKDLDQPFLAPLTEVRKIWNSGKLP
jgi:hypothetical protein